MENAKKFDLSLMNESESRDLFIVRRRVPMKHDFIKGEESKNHERAINQFIYFYKFFETRVQIRKGDVFLARFEYECGNELDGNHYVVAILDSSPNNPMVTIVPLKSAKNRQLNPASDVLIDKIEGLNSSGGSIAIINQIRTIDKRRIFEMNTLQNLNRFMTSEIIGEYAEISCQTKRFYRLTDEQYKKVHKAVEQYVYNGYIKTT